MSDRWSPPSGNAILLTVAVLVLALGGIVGARAYDEPMNELRAATTVSVTTAVTDVAPANARSICVSSASTTCVRVGSKTGGGGAPTATKGGRLGSGCDLGRAACFDVKSLGLFAESGAVSIDVTYGAP